MVNVLIVEKELSEQILIRNNLPDYCAIFTIDCCAVAEKEMKTRNADILLIGPSVPESEYTGLSKIVNSNENLSMFIVLSRQPQAAGSAGRVFKSHRDIRTLFSVFPVREGLLKKHVAAAVSEKLELISAGSDDHPSGRVAEFIGESGVMNRLKAEIRRLGAAPGPVLITGESGTGKEIAAGLVHDYSNRRDEVFHAVNAGAIPDGLSETELFGSEKGAYTGAVSRKGCFEQASGGSLFLDEIGELEKHVQVELLRVLETGRIRRIGGERMISTDVRLIAATNRDLAEAVDEGKFRHDLLFRINVFQICIPPLREHLEDIPDLLRHFSGQLKEDRPDVYYEFSDSFIDGLFDYSWPGNVRELQNVFKRAVYASDSEVLTADSLRFDLFGKA